MKLLNRPAAPFIVIIGCAVALYLAALYMIDPTWFLHAVALVPATVMDFVSWVWSSVRELIVEAF